MLPVDKVQQSQLNKSRTDKFLLVVDLPPILRNYDTNTLAPTPVYSKVNSLINVNSLQFSVFGSVVPKITVPEVEAGYAGGTYKLSSNSRPPYDNVKVNFTIDNKFNNYWVIYRWLNLLSNARGVVYNAENVLPSEPSSNKLPLALQPISYQTDFTIFGKDEFDNNVIKFTYTKAFPVALDPIDYNYREANEIETSFEFAFSQFFAELL